MPYGRFGYQTARITVGGIWAMEKPAERLTGVCLATVTKDEGGGTHWLL